MSKELTPLQALDLIVADLDSVELEKEINIIETAIKDYEHSQQQRELYFKQAKELKSIELDNKKKLKALEIIKEKKWLVEDILNAFIEDKEEYELLKEILK